jgi:hypothetical protein
VALRAERGPDVRGDAARRAVEHQAREAAAVREQQVDALLVEGVERDVGRRAPALWAAVAAPALDGVVERPVRRHEPLGQRGRVARDRGMRTGRVSRRVGRSGALLGVGAPAERQREAQGAQEPREHRPRR